MFASHVQNTYRSYIIMSNSLKAVMKWSNNMSHFTNNVAEELYYWRNGLTSKIRK